jgi:hypothetical protein
MIAMLQTGGKDSRLGKGSMVSLIFSLRSVHEGFPYILSKKPATKGTIYRGKKDIFRKR